MLDPGDMMVALPAIMISVTVEAEMVVNTVTVDGGAEEGTGERMTVLSTSCVVVTGLRLSEEVLVMVLAPGVMVTVTTTPWVVVDVEPATPVLYASVLPESVQNLKLLTANTIASVVWNAASAIWASRTASIPIFRLAL